eukprot:gene9396-13505_t
MAPRRASVTCRVGDRPGARRRKHAAPAAPAAPDSRGAEPATEAAAA